MARSVNRVILVGNLGKDAELSSTPSGQFLSKVSLATGRKWKDKNTGEWQEETEWHNLVIWGKTAESLTPYLTKGKQIYVEGRIKSRTWEKDGVKHHATDVIVENVVLLSSRGEAGSRPPAAAGGKPASRPAAAAPGVDEGPQEDITEDDIPF